MQLIYNPPKQIEQETANSELPVITCLSANRNYVIHSWSDGSLRVFTTAGVQLWQTNSDHHWHTPDKLTGTTHLFLATAFVGNQLLTAGGDGKLRVHDLLSGVVLKTLSSANKNSITRLLTVANEPNIAFCAHRDGDVVVWDLRAEVPLHSLTASLNVDGVQHIDVSNDLLAVSNSTPDGAISLWNWRTGILAWRQIPAPNMPELDGGKNYIGAQLILEGRVYVGTREGYIFVYDVGSGDEMVKLHHGGHVDGLCRHEGSLISLGNGTIKVWDVASQSIVRERKITDHGFSSFCVMDGFIVVLGANGAASSAGRQSVIDAWSLQDPAVVKRVNTTEDWIRSMVCLEDELVLLVKRYEGWRIEKVPFS